MNFDQLLNEHKLFCEVSEEGRDHLHTIARRRSVGPGETVFRKGDPGDAMYGVLSGTIAIQIASGEGETRVVNHLTEGEVFGEIALIDGQNRTADAVGINKTELVIIRRPDFWQVVDRYPKILLPLMEFLCARLRWLNAQVEESAFLSSEQKLAKKLLHLSTTQASNQKGMRMREIAASQSDLSQLVGVGRESINRILQGWKKREVVELRRGKIIVRDWQYLESC